MERGVAKDGEDEVHCKIWEGEEGLSNKEGGTR